jgi:hypothetical protein
MIQWTRFDGVDSELVDSFLPRELTQELRETLTFAFEALALPETSWGNREFFVRFAQLNPDVCSEFLPIVRNLPYDPYPWQKIRLLVALGDDADLRGLISKLREDAWNEELAEAIIDFWAKVGRPDQVGKEFSDILVEKLSGEEYFHPAIEIARMLLSGFERGLVEPATLMQVAVLEETFPQIRYEALQALQRDLPDNKGVPERLAFILRSTYSIESPWVRFHGSTEYTNKLRDLSASLLVKSVWEIDWENGLVAAEALKYLVALEQLGELPKPFISEYRETCVRQLAWANERRRTWFDQFNPYS